MKPHVIPFNTSSPPAFFANHNYINLEQSSFVRLGVPIGKEEVLKHSTVLVDLYQRIETRLKGLLISKFSLASKAYNE